MSSSEINEPRQEKSTREITLTVPEHRAEQFQALARRVLAVWEYRDTYGEPRFAGRRHRHGRPFGHRVPGGARHGRCAPEGEQPDQTATGGSVETA